MLEAADDAAWAVLTVNLAGSVLLGAVIAAWVDHPTTSLAELGLATSTGFCGALTTFSTLAVDVASRVRADEWSAAAAWGVGSLVAGAAAAGLGAVVARTSGPRTRSARRARR